MTAYSGVLACPVCASPAPEHGWHDGCERCRADGRSVNLLPDYDLGSAGRAPEGQPGIFRHRHLLPLPPDAPVVSLGEGNTPLVSLEATAARLGVGQLLVKDETRNPTWSYKDRLAAVAISRAVLEGADTVIVGTTGNHGAAAAAYAVRAGLRCVAITMESVPLTMKTLMQVYGAVTVATADMEGRMALMRSAVDERGWVPISGLARPPAGSNPWGVDGYKTLAYEVFEGVGAVPDVVVVPVAYGDGLVGIWRGFQDLVALGVADRLPRMVSVDPLGAYEAALAAGEPVPMERRPSVSFSIATPIATEQALVALRGSGGTAVTVGDDEDIMAAQRELAAEGLYLEASSASALRAAGRLVERGEAGETDTVVLVGTATGLKDVGATADRLPAVPVVEPTLAALDEVIAATR